jgi:hypothetical protein
MRYAACGAEVGGTAPMMNTGSGSFRLFETICEELLSRLSHEASEQGSVFAAEARELMTTLERWRSELPSQAQRAAVISRVLDLHRTAMDHLTTRSRLEQADSVRSSPASERTGE